MTFWPDCPDGLSNCQFTDLQNDGFDNTPSSSVTSAVFTSGAGRCTDGEKNDRDAPLADNANANKQVCHVLSEAKVQLEPQQAISLLDEDDKEGNWNKMWNKVPDCHFANLHSQV